MATDTQIGLPADWTAHDETEASPVVVKRGAGVVATLSYDGTARGGYVMAEANLISAAPEMFAELTQFVNGVETGLIQSPAEEALANITRRAKAALAKARGEQSA